MAGIMNMAAATLLMAAAMEPSEMPYRRLYDPPQCDTSPITVAERNRLINKAAAKSRHNTKRKAAKKARRKS